MNDQELREQPLVTDEQANETLIAISTYEGEDRRRFFLDGWNGDSQKKWTEAVKWTRSFYEAERKSNRELVQALEELHTRMENVRANWLDHKTDEHSTMEAFFGVEEGLRAALASSKGIKPTKD